MEKNLIMIQKTIHIDIIGKNSFNVMYKKTDLIFLYILWKKIMNGLLDYYKYTYIIHINNIIVASNGGLSARCFFSLSFTLFVFICRNSARSSLRTLDHRISG